MFLNLILAELDVKLEQTAKSYGGTYVRYADDISIVVNTHDKRAIRKVKKKLRREIVASGFMHHPRKHKTTRLGIDSPAAEVVGVSVSTLKTRPPQRLRRIAFHIAKALGIATTSADKLLNKKLKRAAQECEADDPLKWKAFGYYAYFSSV
jgi:hypothetical protein